MFYLLDLIDWFIEELSKSILLYLTISLQRLVRAAELSSLASVQGSNQRLAVLYFGEIAALKKMSPPRFPNYLDSIVQVFQMTLTLSFRYNIRPNGKADTLTLHGACPVLYGTKWGGSILFIALLDKRKSQRILKSFS